MLSKLSRLLDRHLSPGGDASPRLTDTQKQLAIAALLVEVAITDQHFSQAELDRLVLILDGKFALPEEERQALVEQAKIHSAEATSLHQFTHLLNRACTYEEKFSLLKAMWEIAYADGNLDKYEEYVVRKLADLLHLPHSAFIQARNLAKAERENY